MYICYRVSTTYTWNARLSSSLLVIQVNAEAQKQQNQPTMTSSSSIWMRRLVDYLEISVIIRLQLQSNGIWHANHNHVQRTVLHGPRTCMCQPQCLFCSTDFIANGNKLPVFSLPTPAYAYRRVDCEEGRQSISALYVAILQLSFFQVAYLWSRFWAWRK